MGDGRWTTHAWCRDRVGSCIPTSGVGWMRNAADSWYLGWHDVASTRVRYRKSQSSTSRSSPHLCWGSLHLHPTSIFFTDFPLPLVGVPHKTQVINNQPARTPKPKECEGWWYWCWWYIHISMPQLCNKIGQHNHCHYWRIFAGLRLQNSRWHQFDYLPWLVFYCAATKLWFHWWGLRD